MYEVNAGPCVKSEDKPMLHNILNMCLPFGYEQIGINTFMELDLTSVEPRDIPPFNPDSCPREGEKSFAMKTSTISTEHSSPSMSNLAKEAPSLIPKTATETRKITQKMKQEIQEPCTQWPYELWLCHSNA